MRALFLLLALLAATPASAANVTILRVVDGDTAVTTTGERVRLACLDAPERGKRGAAAATRSLREMVQGRKVGIRRITRDRYGRTIGELYSNGKNVGQELVTSGNAWIYRRYAYQCSWAK